MVELSKEILYQKCDGLNNNKSLELILAILNLYILFLIILLLKIFFAKFGLDKTLNIIN